MMMMALHFTETVPFKDVYVHALVRDEKGQKMSKSKGNVIDPIVLMDQYGADSLRMTLCSMAAQGRDIKLSTQRVEGYRNFITKIWNAIKFFEMKPLCFSFSIFNAASLAAFASDCSICISTVCLAIAIFEHNLGEGSSGSYAHSSVFMLRSLILFGFLGDGGRIGLMLVVFKMLIVAAILHSFTVG